MALIEFIEYRYNKKTKHILPQEDLLSAEESPLEYGIPWL